jgi:hypothetical protein
MHQKVKVGLLICVLVGTACSGKTGGSSSSSSTGGSSGSTGTQPLDPNTAPKAEVDRFSASAGHLMVRSSSNNLPAANAPINFDQGEPFITQGLGPSGQMVKYYNFDVQPTVPAPIYVLFRSGESTPVSGQLNIVNVVPGDTGYNDFWQVMKVTVPSDYVANTLHSFSSLMQSGYAISSTSTLVNCPIVPYGSTAQLRYDNADASLQAGWYNDKVVYYFNFSEAPLMAANNMVPLAGISVAFNINPDQPNGGPPSGFETEANSMQTHNVVSTLPGDNGYSPLWSVSPYDNADFSMVHDQASAQMAHFIAMGVADVNCPIVSVQ